MKRSFQTDYLMDDLFLPRNAVENRVLSVIGDIALRSIIFKADGTYWRATYKTLPTSREPWPRGQTVLCDEVFDAPVVRREWVRVDDRAREPVAFSRAFTDGDDRLFIGFQTSTGHVPCKPDGKE